MKGYMKLKHTLNVNYRSLSCSVSEILPIFHRAEIHSFHTPTLYHVEFWDDSLAADRCFFATR